MLQRPDDGTFPAFGAFLIFTKAAACKIIRGAPARQACVHGDEERGGHEEAVAEQHDSICRRT
jgi:hypothetical protein